MGAVVRLDARRLERMLTRVGGPGERLLRRRANRVRELARAYAWTHGSMADMIVVGPYDAATKSITVISQHPATVFVHNGTRAHEIRPRYARALRFVHRGRVVYARRVWHPGYPGDPFLTKALRDAG